MDVASAIKSSQAALASGQAHVDAVISFMRERTLLEEAHGRALQRLSRSALLLDGAGFIRALRSRRGVAPRAPRRASRGAES